MPHLLLAVRGSLRSVTVWEFLVSASFVGALFVLVRGAVARSLSRLQAPKEPVAGPSPLLGVVIPTQRCASSDVDDKITNV